MNAMISRAARLPMALTAAALLVACQEPTSIVERAVPAEMPVARFSDVRSTLSWNQLARDLVVQSNMGAPPSIRMFALLSLAQHDAIVIAEKEKDGPVHPAERGAIAGASAAILTYIFPSQASFLEAIVDLYEVMGVSPAGARQDFAAGEAIGRRVAAELIARASTDGFFAPFTGTVPLCDSCWLATSPPAFATLGQAKTFMLTSGSQFRPEAPPAFSSPAFASALAEVRQIADTRTVAQDSIAKFWALPVGTVGAQGYFNEVASNLAARYERSERETARMLALLNVAAFDGLIASHEAKYHYWLIRPSQADAGIVRAIGLPSFPSYPSNHSMLAATAATVLGAFFPSERKALEAMAEEGAISRLYGGIHYRFDTEAGLALGRKVADWTLAHDVVGREPFGFR